MRKIKYVDIVILKISSYIGIVPGAMHIFGSMFINKKINRDKYKNYKYVPNEAIVVERVLSNKEDAEELSSSSYKYKIGDLTNRFNSEENLIKEAIVLYKNTEIFRGKPFVVDYYDGSDLKLIPRIKFKVKIGNIDKTSEWWETYTDEAWLFENKDFKDLHVFGTKIVNYWNKTLQPGNKERTYLNEYEIIYSLEN